MTLTDSPAPDATGTRSERADAELVAAIAQWRRTKANSHDAASGKDAWYAGHIALRDVDTVIARRGGEVCANNPVFLGLWLVRHGLDPFQHSSAIAKALGRKRDFSDAAFDRMFRPIVAGDVA